MAPAAPKGHVIIGNGAAAVEACRGMRKSGFAGPIDVFAAGNLPVYNPMLTTYYVAGKIEYSLLFPYGDSNAVFEKYRATLHPNSPVTALSVKNRTVTATNGETFTFNKCLIASGASPVVPPLPGANSPKVFTMRTVEDAVALKAAMEKGPKRALVVGASMVGIKLVEMFWKAGLQVDLVDMADRIFPLAAHPDCSGIIERRLAGMGIGLRFSAALERLEDTDHGVLAWFKGDDRPIETDIVLMCVGVRPNLGFVDRAEIEVRQGVLVDMHMESSAPGIYAAGDVAQGMNLQSGQQQLIGLWASARNQGFTAGCNMGGQHREYAGEILHNITHFMGMDFVGIGDACAVDTCEIVETDNGFSQLLYKNGQVCGANFLDLYTEAGMFKNAFTKNIMGRQQPENDFDAPGYGHMLRRMFRSDLR